MHNAQKTERKIKMTIGTTVIPSRIDASATDGEYVTTTTDDKLTLGNKFFKEQAETEIEIIELQANTGVTPLDHDSLVSDTFSDANGYEDSVNTGNTTGTFSTDEYTSLAVVETNDSTTSMIGAIGFNSSKLKFQTSFIPDGEHTISIMGLYMRRAGTPTGNISISIFLADGSTNPTGASLGDSNSVNIASVVTSGNEVIPFTFPTPILLEAATRYCVVMTPTYAVSSSNHIISIGGASAGDNASQWNGSAWVVDSGGYRTGFIFYEIDADGMVEIDLPVISGEVLATALILNSDGGNTYKLIDTDSAEDDNLDLDTKNDLSSCDGTKISEGKIQIKLESNVKTYALKIWKV